MTWKKGGRIYEPRPRFAWMVSHAQLPTLDPVGAGRLRIYFAVRDELNRTRPTFIEVSQDEPTQILYHHDRPVLDLGCIGTFDDSGVMPGWIVTKGDRKYLFYTGWTSRGTVPYHNAIGLAISCDGGVTFERASEAPIFGTTSREPYINGSPCVLVEDRLWRCWYFSCTRWEMVGGKLEPRYHIKYAESHDGIDWQRDGVVAIDYKSDGEAVGRAAVIKEASAYRMWYSYRSTSGYRTDRRRSYRIGYAESLDGIRWSRLDERAGIDISDRGWDSEMIAYPYVLIRNGLKHLFYNGNGFGRSGFGYATESSV